MLKLGRACTTLLAIALLSTGCRLAPQDRTAPTPFQSSECPTGIRALSASEEGSGPTLVMLGGVLTGATGLAPVAAHLAPHRRVIRLQNFNVESALSGETLPAEYGVRFESCAMLAALDRLGVDTPVDLVGYSYGGLIALDFALRHPEQVRSITVVEPPTRGVLSQADLGSPNQVHFAQAATAIRRRVPSQREVAAFVCIVFGCAPGDQFERARQLPLWPIAMQNRRSLAGVFATVEYRPPVPYGTLRAPLLYVSGSGTSEFHSIINTRFRQVLPQATYLELPGGHAAPSVSSAALAAAILDFTTR